MSEFAFSDWNLNSVDLFHFFNHVSVGSTPFVTTFETFVPRPPQSQPYSEPLRQLLEEQAEALVGRPCRKLIAISESARRCQAKHSETLGCPDELSAKTVVIHPPQVLRERVADENFSRPVIFTLVGHYFFSKGGLELLQAMDLWNQMHPGTVRLNIVSKIALNHTATGDDERTRTCVLQTISKNASWIRHFPVLEPEEVARLQAQTDVGLLPSLAETYGYSILEFQSFGVPVLTTNVRAMPELNTDRTGWVVPLPVDELGYLDRTQSSDAEIRAQLRTDILRAIEEIVSNPNDIRAKGDLAQQRIRSMHDPETFASTLLNIYTEAIG
jgi:glycosyltransferase involved in cell wall biosynthesis